MYLHLKVVDLDKAGPPEFYGKYIIFTYASNKPVRSVTAVFEHEGYGIQHSYQYNEKGIFFLIYSIPPEYLRLRYRIIVDGLIMKDPANPDVEEDLLGIEYSIVKITKIMEKEVVNPEFTDTGEVRFVYNSRPGRIISLVGSFNDWDPYMHFFKEGPAGHYTITIRVGEGRHFYYFIIDGEKIIDLYNDNVGLTAGGDTVSYFDYP
jgi:hypothetical protein